MKYSGINSTQLTIKISLLCSMSPCSLLKNKQMKKVRNIFILLIFTSTTLLNCNKKNNKDEVWKEANKIIETIGTTSFPDQVFNIVDFGAIADEKTLNTLAINQAIKKCSESGGGTVLVPEGEFLTGAIHMEDNVNLKISSGATLMFSTDPKDYLPLVKTSWEGILCYNYSPMIYAIEKNNIAITGKGKLDGMSKNENWWKLKGKKKYGWKEGIACQLDPEGRPLLDQYNEQQTPVEERIMGDGHFLRPHFIQFLDCKNILLENVTIENSPFWIVHPVLCENITVRGLVINSNGPNNDGCDPESCKNVLIEDCLFNTGDDCIALKSGRDEDGRAINKPIENVVIRNCIMKNGHGGVVLGSEISGGCKNIFVENCQMSSPELDRAIRIKTNNNRGGVTENIFIRNIQVGEVKEAVIRINCSYDQREGQGNFIPMVKDVYISDIHSKKAQYALKLEGLKGEKCVQNININNCRFDGVELENSINFVEGLKFNEVFINNKAVE